MTTPNRLRTLAAWTKTCMTAAASDIEQMERTITVLFERAGGLRKTFQEAMARLDEEMTENNQLRMALQTLHESADGMTPNELRAFVDGVLEQHKDGTQEA